MNTPNVPTTLSRSARPDWGTMICFSLFAIAMALLEAVIVVYLRELDYPGDVRVIFPARVFSNFDLAVELARELATIVMLLAVAFLVKPATPHRIFAAFHFLFGTWDLFNYVWLRVMIDWPVSVLEWDLLFLIPHPWLGPWIFVRP